ncbi:Transcription initiation factor IIA subunit 1 [Taenia crassiceps]|uniref:Transcription initiation factor IIA subunit 1 n=1 Tax=Taenia crassiceps TaxID=6207 RepID=A0ABR4Q221_9CEST
MVDVAGFYNGVINDVIEGMKETFTQEGLDLDLLEQLRKLWSSKLAETHVADPEPVAQPAVHYAQRLQATQFQTCMGQQGMPISISRLPIQPNSLAGVGGGGGVGAGGAMRTLAPIARPNAPLTMSAAAPTTGLVLRSAVGASVQAPGTTAGRPPIVLAAALNPQAAGVQPRLASPLAGIAIRTPLQAAGPGQPGAATTATIIGQPTMASVNGVPAIPGQNVQILQVGQQTFMVPVQFRQPMSSAASTTQQLQDATGTTATAILAAAAASAPQQTQTQSQSFNRTQVDGVDDSDFDDDDDDVEVVEPYSVDTPSLRAPMSVATPHSVFSRTPGSAAQPLVGGSSGGVGGGGSSGGGGAATTATPGGDGEDDSDDDDADMVVATPGVAGSMLTPNPASVAAVTSTTPTTPRTMLNSNKTSVTAATVTTSTNSTTKRSYDAVCPDTVAGGGGGGVQSRNRVAKRSRSSVRVGKEFREFDDDIDDDLADDEDDEEDVEDEEEEEFGSVATMTPSGQRLEMLAAAAAASAEEAAMGGRPVSRRKQRTPTAVAGADRLNAQTGGSGGGGGEDDHIPDLPPPAPPPQPPTNGGDENVSGGGGVGTEEDAEEMDGRGTGLAAEEEEEEPLNSGDDVSDEEPESLFESDNLVVCQYERVSRSRSKWRFWLRDGIMKIRGRDHLFQKLIVEADWLIVPANSVPALEHCLSVNRHTTVASAVYALPVQDLCIVIISVVISDCMVMGAASISANFAQQIPGWLGTLAISFDGGIVYSAGELSGNTESAPKFIELARHVAEYMNLEDQSAFQENPFKRLTIICSRYAYAMTAVGGVVYVIKRQLSPSDSHEDRRGIRSSHMPVNV